MEAPHFMFFGTPFGGKMISFVKRGNSFLDNFAFLWSAADGEKEHLCTAMSVSQKRRIS